MVIKWLLSRRVRRVGAESGSTAVQADAVHHLSDAITSGAAFIGITIALHGSRLGPAADWASADDWAALLASAVIAFNGASMARAAINDLMDRMPGPEIVDPIRRAAEGVVGVCRTEKLAVRKSGLAYWVTIHVQTNPAMPLRDAHILGGMVKSAIRAAVPRVASVLVHMEPIAETSPTPASIDGTADRFNARE